MAEEINHQRRRFISAAAMTVAAARLGVIGSEQVQADETSSTNSAALPASKLGTNTSFGALKQIAAGVLNVGYAEAGPADGRVGAPAARLALRHPQLRGCRATTGIEGLPRDCPFLARLWHDALLSQ